MAGMREEDRFRVLEFYSGIGGMHFALKESGISAHVIGAVDINTIANVVYKRNFPSTPSIQRNIEGISLTEFSKLKVDIFLMSPPCQPFSRLGNKGASRDPRTKSFLYILDILKRLPHPPDYLLMENVKGFETSDTRELFISTLKECNYTYQEFLLTPMQFRIPNSRLRYYLLAKRRPLKFSFETTECILEDIPGYCKCSCGICRVVNCIPVKTAVERVNSCDTKQFKNCNGQHKNCGEVMEDKDELTSKPNVSILSQERDSTELATDVNAHTCTCQSCESRQMAGSYDTITLKPFHKHCRNCILSKPCKKLAEYLEALYNETFWREYLLPAKILGRFALVLDIVMPSSSHSCCFTKGYGHYSEGTGSVLQMASMNNSEVFEQYKTLADEEAEEKAELLSVLQLRYFTAREVANLMCFPPEFGFPSDVSLKQQYRLLGNSLNVHVVSELLKCLISG